MTSPRPSTPAREPDTLFGALAIRLGFSTPERVEESLTLQARMKEMGIPSRRLGDILAARGYLTEAQQEAIYSQQCRQDGIPVVPGYRILGRIGKGAFGSVYKAVQTSLDRVVAVKGLAPQYARSRGFRQRLLNEARLVARLNHPHIVQGIDVVETDESVFLVMEYIDGPSVARLLQDGGRIHESLALRVASQVASALHHAQTYGIVHRDIKPENIMLTRKGVAKLCDLGVAKLSGPGSEGDPSAPPRMVGTPYYISPEQARGEQTLEARSDIYSLGATLYHMLTGHVPFEGPTSADVISKHLTQPPVPPSQHNPDISPDVEVTVLKMMKKDSRERFQSPRELYQEFQRIRAKAASGADSPRPGSLRAIGRISTRRFLRRPPPGESAS